MRRRQRCGHYPGFPANWHSARLLRRFLEAYHREETTDVAVRLKIRGEVAPDASEPQRLRALQRPLGLLEEDARL